MNIETKYNPEQMVWYIGTDFKAKEGKIDSVQTTVQIAPSSENRSVILVAPGIGEHGKPQTITIIQYLIEARYMVEARVFGTREELVAYVTGQ